MLRFRLFLSINHFLASHTSPRLNWESDHLHCMEVSGGELVPMASTDFHTQFFQGAELMGGEMELGFSNVMSPQDLFIHHNNSSPSSSSMSSIESPSLVFNANPIATSIHSFRPPQLLSPESEQAEMTRAILAILSSSSSSPNQPQNPKASNFKKYSSTSQSQMMVHEPSMFKRSIMYYRNLNQATLNSTSKTQLQHMISERRRRHKQNHNLQTLRSLLPPGSKKDKASVLTSTREYLSLLRDEVAELSQRNQILDAQLRQDCSSSSSSIIEEDENNGSCSNVEVGMRRISGTQHGLSTVEVKVSVRGECSPVELLIRLLHLFKMDLNHFIALLSIQAKRLINRLNLILQIQVSEWDESAFGEAVKGVINDILSSKSNQYACLTKVN